MQALLPLVHRLLAGAALALALLHTAFADPPGRVGRLADMQGQVWLYDAQAADWADAGRNRPLTTGDRLATGANARAEVRVGSTTLRLAAGTEVEFLQLDDERVRVQLHTGWLALRLRTQEAAQEFELVTAEGRFKPDRAGRYRLDRVDATTSATVWSGQLLFEAPDNAATLVAGQRADIWNNGRTQLTLVQPQQDAFASEVAASELADERSVSARYVSPEMTGVEELDRHGRWENDADYGALWVPRAVQPGWVPYRFGHWAWVNPWGWTWVDDAPWGFAPFHYGRWVFLRNTWCWSPGTWVARPVYAPALVAWVGAPGIGVGVTVGGGPRVGWFPLGPREVFVPGYRTSPRYVRNVNVTQVTNITNVTNIINSPNTVVGQTNYVNRGVPGAVTVVPSNVVSGRQPVAPARVQITDPRPGRSGQDLQVAALPNVTAVAPVQPPAPPSMRPGMPPRNGDAPRERPAAPPVTTAPRTAAPGAAPNPGVPAVPTPSAATPQAPGAVNQPPAPATLPSAPPAHGGTRAPVDAPPTQRAGGGSGRYVAAPGVQSQAVPPPPAPQPAPRTVPQAGTQPSVPAQPRPATAPSPNAGTPTSPPPSRAAQPGAPQGAAPHAGTAPPAAEPAAPRQAPPATRTQESKEPKEASRDSTRPLKAEK